jgi:monoamine oxidase
MYDYIIIGGGISGLYCALNLHNCLLLESNDYLGGRILTNKKPHYEIGAGRYSSKDNVLISLINHFKLTPIQIGSKIDYIHKTDNGPLYVENADKLFNEKIKLLHKAKLQSTLYNITMEEYCIKTFGKKTTEDLINMFGYSAEFKKLNAYDSIKQLSKYGHESYFVVKEGFSELVKRISKHIYYKLNHTVKHIEQIDNYYKVDQYLTKRIIFAIPPTSLLKFPILKPITPLLETVDANKLLRIYAIYENRWFEGLPTMTTNSFIRHIIPINSKTGLIMIAYVEGDDTDAYLNKEGKIERTITIKNKIQRELKLLFPDKKIIEPIYFKTHMWNIGDHTWKPGNNTEKIAKEILNPMKNIYICGEAFSHNQAWMEGALQTASKVIDIL